MDYINNPKKLNRQDFQSVINEKKTDLYILKNQNQLEMAVTNYGAAILSLITPDKNGNFANIIQGHDSLQHLKDSPVDVLSTTIGRYGNRIAKGHFTLDGKEYNLAINNGLIPYMEVLLVFTSEYGTCLNLTITIYYSTTSRLTEKKTSQAI